MSRHHTTSANRTPSTVVTPEVARIEQLLGENASLKGENARLLSAMEDRSYANVVLTSTMRQSRDGTYKIDVVPICICDKSDEGNLIFDKLVARLEESNASLPEDVNWSTVVDVPMNEVQELPDGVTL